MAVIVVEEAGDRGKGGLRIVRVQLSAVANYAIIAICYIVTAVSVIRTVRGGMACHDFSTCFFENRMASRRAHVCVL